MQNPIYTITLYVVLSQIILFIWYYLTLPGVLNGSKTIKPTVKYSLSKFLIFMLPFYIYIAYTIYIYKNSKGKICEQLPLMIDVIKQLCTK